MAIDEFTRRRRRKQGDLGSLRRSLWAGLLHMEDLLTEEDPNTAIRVAHALAALSGAYMKACELHDVIGRIAALEAATADANVLPIRKVS